MQFAAYIATSLEGYIARVDGSIDWLEQAGLSTPQGEDYGYADFMASVDCLIMGRATFDMVRTFAEYPYQGKRVIVLSRTLTVVPKGFKDKVELHGSSLTALLAKLEHDGHQRAYVDGGKTIQTFIKTGLLDELIITRVPVLIGAGLPLFGGVDNDVMNDVMLEHLSTRSYANGFVQSRYWLTRPDARTS
jgi:dihydrofolate reductase